MFRKIWTQFAPYMKIGIFHANDGKSSSGGILSVMFVLFILMLLLSSLPLLFLSSGVIFQSYASPQNTSAVRLGPSSNILSGPSSKTASGPGCSSSPCPMGVVEYGVTPTHAKYSYNAKVVEGRVDIADLSLGSKVNGCLDPYTGYCFDIQLNWIANQLVDGRNVPGVYWAQDVAQIGYENLPCPSPCVQGAFSVTFLDNVWNFSYPSILLDQHCGTSQEQGCMQRGFSGNGEGKCASSGTPSDDYYYCETATYYTSQSRDFTIWLKTDVEACAAGGKSSCFHFYGAVLANNQILYQSTYDYVQFTNTAASNPQFHIQAVAAPYPVLYDGELVATGPCCSENQIVDMIATWQEFYSASLSPTHFVSVHHAWSSGLDTGETATYVQMYGFGGSFDSATSGFNPDNPRVSLW
jgi:hypothetical protein